MRTPRIFPAASLRGGTRAETELLIREAIEMHLHGLKKDGEPVPEPTTVADYIHAST